MAGKRKNFFYSPKEQDSRHSIFKQVKAAPQFRLGASHRAAGPAEFTRFHEKMRGFERCRKKSFVSLFRSHGTEIRFLYHNSWKRQAFRHFLCDRGMSLILSHLIRKREAIHKIWICVHKGTAKQA